MIGGLDLLTCHILAYLALSSRRHSCQVSGFNFTNVHPRQKGVVILVSPVALQSAAHDTTVTVLTIKKTLPLISHITSNVLKGLQIWAKLANFD